MESNKYNGQGVNLDKMITELGSQGLVVEGCCGGVTEVDMYDGESEEWHNQPVKTIVVFDVGKAAQTVFVPR